MKLFDSVKIKKPKSSRFNLDHEFKFTCNMGELIPVYLSEVLPAEKQMTSSSMIARFHPMLAPIMHRIDAYVHYFYVPNRILFKDWDKFITGGDDGKFTGPFPTLDIMSGWEDRIKAGSLADYLGIPTMETGTISGTVSINALPFRAYAKIWNEYYRDQNLQDEIPVTDDNIVSTGESDELYKLRKRAWSKDYFTSALPFSQKGDSVMLPTDTNMVLKNPAHALTANNSIPTPGDVSTNSMGELMITGTGIKIDNIENVELQATINDLRTATRLQEWLEKNARAGSRLFESTLAHWGIAVDDLRISRPKYLGGGRIPIVISEVLSTFENANTELGKMGGHGISVGSGASFKAFFKEHGFVMGLMTIMPKPSYQQGLHKMWKRFDKFDYAWPEFANLGEQEILNQELYLDWTNRTNDNGTFGYTPRYSEYKTGINRVAGDFKTTLDYWHAGRIFDNLPTLSPEFIECDTSTIDDRIFPVADAQATDKIYVQMYNSVKCVKALPYYGTPRL